MLLAMKTILQSLSAVVATLVLGFLAFLGYATLSDFRPPLKTRVYEGETTARLSMDRTYDLMIWNIGYAGLSREMDFFYDGQKYISDEYDSIRIAGNFTFSF